MIHEYQVFIDNDVLKKMRNQFIEARPNEAYGFLGGRIVGRHCYTVDLFCAPLIQKTTADSFTMTDEDKTQANMFISQQGLDLIGIAHSHLLTDGCGILPSINDARLQLDNHFILSMILTIPDHNARSVLTCWLNGFAAPIDIKLRNKPSKELSQVLEFV